MPTSTPDLDARLAAVPLLAGLSRRQRKRLLDQARVVDHPAGHEVAREGEGALALHVVLEGTATVSVGGAQVRALAAGDYFGEVSLIDGRPRSATVTADDALQVLAVPHHAFRAVLADDPAAVQALLVELCARLRDAEAR